MIIEHSVLSLRHSIYQGSGPLGRRMASKEHDLEIRNSLCRDKLSFQQIFVCKKRMHMVEVMSKILANYRWIFEKVYAEEWKLSIY